MSLSSDFFEELELLTLFNIDNTQEGIKIHHEASPSRIASAKRLFDKNLITLSDGGYLTAQGADAAAHARALMNILRYEN